MKNLFLSFICLFTSTLFAQNYCLSFDGNDDYVEISQLTELTADNFAVEFWMKCEVDIDPQIVFMAFQDQTVGNANLAFEVSRDGFMRLSYRSSAAAGGGTDMYSTTNVADNEWHHVAFVKHELGNIYLLIDGFVEGSACGVASISNPPIVDLGRNRYASAEDFRHYTGKLDDLKIWNTAKSNRQIFMDKNSEHSGLEFGLVHNYKMDTPSDTIYDCSTAKLHGLRIGPAGSNNKPQFSNDVPTLVDVECSAMFVGLNDAEKTVFTDIVELSPNPASEFLLITFVNQFQDVQAKIYASEGKLLENVYLNAKSNTLNISHLPRGVYYLQIDSVDGSFAKKFVKN